MVDFFKRFYDGTKQYSSSHPFTYSSVATFYEELIDKADHLRNIDQSDQMAETVYAKLIEYKAHVITNEAKFTRLLDPFHKFYIKSDEKPELLAQLRDLIEGQGSSDHTESNSTFNFNASFAPPPNEDDDDEVTAYENMVRPRRTQDIPTWWLNHRSDFPNIFKLAEKEMVTRPSSVASESAFSAAKWLIGDRRCLLSDESIRALLFLHCTTNYQGDLTNINDSDDEQE